MKPEETRRAFLSNVALGFAAMSCQRGERGGGAAQADAAAASGIESSSQGVPTKLLGQTGVYVSIIGLGGAHIGKPDKKLATAIMHRAIDEGITFFDNCWDYNDGESERRMGEALHGERRQRVFLMSKIDGRTKDVAAEQIDQSLGRLRTDTIDLMQVHEVIRGDDPERVFAEGGAIEALQDAKKAGKIRFIGFTGHKDPDIHLHMLEVADEHGFRFDSVQMPINAMDPHFKSFERTVLPVLRQKGIGVLGMKALGSGILLESGVVTAPECLRYALTVGPDVVITGIDGQEILTQALSLARSYTPLSDAEMLDLLLRTEAAGNDGRFEKFKTSRAFDGTEKNPHWLTSARL